MFKLITRIVTRKNRVLGDIIIKAIKYSKDGYNMREIANLISDILQKLFKVPASINFDQGWVTIKFKC